MKEMRKTWKTLIQSKEKQDFEGATARRQEFDDKLLGLIVSH